jgi:hypothetical protein
MKPQNPRFGLNASVQGQGIQTDANNVFTKIGQIFGPEGHKIGQALDRALDVNVSVNLDEISRRNRQKVQPRQVNPQNPVQFQFGGENFYYRRWLGSDGSEHIENKWTGQSQRIR